MIVTINKSAPNGIVNAPPSKSYAHRILIATALSDGNIDDITLNDSADIIATKDCVASIFENSDFREFRCNESGSTLRFLIPLSCVYGNGGRFICSERLAARGVGVYQNVLADKGVCVKEAENGFSVFGKLSSGEYIVPGNISSQFVSGLLFALPLLPNDSTVCVLPPVESRQYIDITVDVLKKFGITINEFEDNKFLIPGGQKYKIFDCSVPGDWSNAAFFYAIKMLGNDIIIGGLDNNSIQGDAVCVECFEKLKNGFCSIDISNSPDLGPVLFAFAAANNGAKFTGTKRLKIKESNRAEAMACELCKFGIKTDVYDDVVIVNKGKLTKPNETLNSHNDHRIVMALSVLLTLTGGKICGAQAVNKSFPEFFSVLESLGVNIEYGDNQG